jgi:predicted alpha-1,6-mannanase (GH76 family)
LLTSWAMRVHALLLGLLVLTACGEGSRGDATPAATSGVDGAPGAAGDGGSGPTEPSNPDAAPSNEDAGTTAEGGGADGSAGDGALLAAHADEALERFLVRYWTGSYMAANSPRDANLTGYWTFAQAFDNVLDGFERTGGTRYWGTIETFYLAQNTIGWSRDYYDDEDWMALALIRAYDLTQTTKYLDEAKSLMSDIMAAWDTTCCGTSPGGIWWDRSHTQKATAANAGPVITATRLAARTGDASYLTFAKQVYSYWLTTMVDPTTHQVADHLLPDGTIVRWKYTYNEGLMIGASVELAAATGDTSYLATAHDIASFVLKSESESTSLGAVLSDGKCGGDCMEFKGIAYRYLTALDLAEPDPALGAFLDASASAVWTLARDPNLDTFSVEWSGPPVTSSTLNEDSAALMALALAARRAGAPAPPPPTSGLLEAEDGVLHGVGLEATHVGFSGWGYLAGWNGDGQWVDFHFQNSSAGSRKLTFHYAAGAGDATRYLYANGQGVVDAVAFPSTGSWDSYATVTVDVTLPAGANTVSLIYDSSKNSSNYLNLDSLTLSAP